MENDQRQTHVAVMPSPGMGHIIPFAGFAKRLVDDHGVDVTLIVVSAGPLTAAEKAYLGALPAGIHSVLIPPVELQDLPESSSVETIISETALRSLPAVYDALRLRPPAALVVDLFCTTAFEVARKLDVRPYMFFTSTATCLSFVLHHPELEKTSEAEYRDWPDKIRLPGCIPLNGSDLPDPYQNRKSESYAWVLRHGRRCCEAEGIFVNTFPELEPGPLAGLGSVKHFPPVYPIGPLIQSRMDATREECLNWLDHQPAESVLFVSFGSGGTLSTVQTAELAAGLELSGQRFLWVVRKTSDTESNAAYFTHNTPGDDPLAHLPDGFLTRTSGVGLAVPRWAPQVKVLEHTSTGGFLTHCGWNSVLESVVNGVPMIAWPLYAEQKMNAVMLVEETGVALRPATAAESAVVGREEVARVVRELMEGDAGKRVLRRVRELMKCGVNAMGPDGSSYRNLSQRINAWK